MPILDTIELLYRAFQENPVRRTYSTSRLCSQYSATELEVKQAKELYRLNPKDYTTAQALSLEEDPIEGKTYYTSLEEIFTGKLNEDILSKGILYGERNPKGKGILEQTEEQWEVKQKWVKGKEGSQLMVKKEVEVDYKKEFENFLSQYKPIKKPLKANKEDGILFIYLADQHIGAETKSNSLLPNEYGAKQIGDRMMDLAEEILRLDSVHYLNQIVVVNLGDAVDGFNARTTRGGHKLPQNMNNREVYNTFLQVHTDFFDTLQQCDCKNFAYISVGESNHGGDFEWMCNKSLETILNAKYSNIETHVGEKFIEHFTYGEHAFVFCHGKDMEDMKFGLPKNLDPKTEIWIKSYVDQMGINTKFVHFLKGDLHLSNSEYSSFLRYKNCLSMYGSSKWVQTNFMKNTKGVSMDILWNGSLTEHTLFFN